MQMSKLIEEPKKQVVASHVSIWHYDPEKKILLIEKGTPFKVNGPKSIR